MNDFVRRFDRNIRMFGFEGQRRLQQMRVAIVGVGGLGTHVVQQLTLLGVEELALIDHEELSHSNKNRYIGCRHDDPIPGTLKVDAAVRLVQSIDPAAKMIAIASNLISEKAFNALRRAHCVFGCIDDDGARFVLNDLATAYGIPYIDLATDVAQRSFGGRIVFKTKEIGCLYCFDELDPQAVQRFLEAPEDKLNRESVYGVPQEVLENAGPAVVSVNGVVASLAVTEFMVAFTGMSQPQRFINYDGSKSRALPRSIEGREDCPYCRQWGHGDRTDPDRYLRSQFKCTV